MDAMVKAAFVRQKKEPNKRLQSIIRRVEQRHSPFGKQLQDDQLSQVWAAGTGNLLPKKEKDDA